MARISVGCCAKMKDAQIFNFLSPILKSKIVEKVHIVREIDSEPISDPKVEYHKIRENNNILRLISYYKKCRELTLSGKIDAWISFYNIPYGLIVYFSTKKTNIPYHIGFVGSDWYGVKRRIFLNNLYPKQIPCSDFITVTGKEMEVEVKKFASDYNRIKILPHSIDDRLFHDSSHISKEYDMIFVGQLIDRKRPESLIKVLENLNKLNSSFKICIVGDGDKRDYLVKLAKKKGLEKQLFFKGFVNYKDYVKLLQKSRVFFLPSSMEGFPFALVEAMAVGLVPVCSDVGTISDHLVHGKNGFIFHPNNLNGFTKILFKLLNDNLFYDKIAVNVRDSSKKFRYSESTKIWDSWFNQINNNGETKNED